MVTAVAVNKTLYVRDEDVQVWDKARELVGDKLSIFLTNYLRTFVDQKQSEDLGYDRIVVTYVDGGMPRAQAFHGRWIIPPSDPWVDYLSEVDFADSYALAETARGRFVIFNFNPVLRPSGGYEWGLLKVFDSLDMAAGDDMVPAALITEAIEKIGIPIEELDI